jgi:hypothetical protein
MPVIPAFGRLRQEDEEFKACLGYAVRPHLKKNQNSPSKTKPNVNSNLHYFLNPILFLVCHAGS